MFYFPEELNEKIITLASDWCDDTLIPLFEDCGIQCEIEKDGELMNTQEYQEKFEVFYDYITNALYGVHRGDKHVERTDLPFPSGLSASELDTVQKDLENEIRAFMPNCLMQFGSWSEPVFRLWKTLPKAVVESWLDDQKNERSFIRQYGRVALRQMNNFTSSEGLENMYDLSTAHMPNTEPDFGDLRFEQYEYGYVVWVVSEDLLDEGDVPQWLYPIMEQAIYNECQLIKFDADANVVSHFDTYEWEI